MHVLVCLKQVLDPEIPPRAFRVRREELRPDVPGAALVTSIFDANALEVALGLREVLGGSVTALSLGPPSAEEVLRKALAVTADQAVLLADPAFALLDPAGVATALAAAARRLQPDLILTGRQAGDVEHGQTGAMLAEALGWPCVSLVASITADGDGLRLRREVEDGSEWVAAGLPLVATVTNAESNQLRLAKVRDVMAAHRKPLSIWSAADLGLTAAALAARTELVDLFVPERRSECEWIDGEDGAARGRRLAQRLRELGVL